MGWLKELRIHTQLTGERVSILAKISPQYYNFIENEKRRPSVPVAKRIAVVLDFDWTRFFDTDCQDIRTAAPPMPTRPARKEA